MAHGPLFMVLGVGALLVFSVAMVAWGWMRKVVPARGALLYFGWIALSSGLALSGVLARFDARPPPFALLFAGTMATAFTLGLSSIGKEVATRAPLALLIGAQVFRLPLELIMAWGASRNIVPHMLAFGGANFDIFTGVTALPVAWAASRGHTRVVWAWNILGFAALASIAVIALLTAPFVQAFGPSEVNRWVAYFPFCEVPAAFVAFALASHIIIVRALRARKPG